VEAQPREIRIFETAAGRKPFSDWMDTLVDEEIYGVILTRIDRVEDGNFGDCEPVGSGVHELKIDVGPGYRVYFGCDGEFVILLGGGKKKTQTSDIALAKERWEEYNA
jgi:putative addiction module killer protein